MEAEIEVRLHRGTERDGIRENEKSDGGTPRQEEVYLCSKGFDVAYSRAKFETVRLLSHI